MRCRRACYTRPYERTLQDRRPPRRAPTPRHRRQGPCHAGGGSARGAPFGCAGRARRAWSARMDSPAAGIPWPCASCARAHPRGGVQAAGWAIRTCALWLCQRHALGVGGRRDPLAQALRRSAPRARHRVEPRVSCLWGHFGLPAFGLAMLCRAPLGLFGRSCDGVCDLLQKGLHPRARQ